MELKYNKPEEIIEEMRAASEKKTELDLKKLVIKAILAGMFIAFGAAASSTAIFGIEDIGIAKTIAGVIFPSGLIMVILLGGELFTGDCLAAIGSMGGNIRISQLVRLLVLVYLGNMVGSVLIAIMVYGSGQLDYGQAALGAATIKTALGKLTQSPERLFISGILCNILVCVAVLLAGAAKDVVGKIFAVFFPILAFVTGGYEHCIANMYYIPAGILAAGNQTYRQAAQSIYGMTEAELANLNVASFLMNNLLPVTIGNIVGGILLVSVPCYLVYAKGGKADDRVFVSRSNRAVE